MEAYYRLWYSPVSAMTSASKNPANSSAIAFTRHSGRSAFRILSIFKRRRSIWIYELCVYISNHHKKIM